MKNIDAGTVDGFGDEWERFDQTGMSVHERDTVFSAYFSVFPWEKLSPEAVGCDIGCGSGRWAKAVAPRVGHLHCVDPSSAIEVARRNLDDQTNITLHKASVDDLPFVDGSLDFGYSLGVLHHIPDTKAAMASCVRKLKPGAPFLVYLYYAFDNKPAWFRMVWKASDLLRRFVSIQPHWLRYFLSQILAFLIYFPLARSAGLGERAGLNVANWPLSGYRRNSFYTMRTDALDRFGTRLEHRFTRAEIGIMMASCGLEGIRFAESLPYWCAVGTKKVT
jgi:ubiquinone/menaquinone biosynthesis C-methylase UbiE